MILKHSRRAQRGGALVMAVMATSTIGVLAMSMVAIQVSGAVEQGSARQEARASLAAEAGLSQAYMNLQASRSGVIGSANAPTDMAGGEVYVGTQIFGTKNNLVRVTSNASVGRSNASAELVLRDNVNTLFKYAAFGDSQIDLDNQAMVDSYDSTLGSYASQVVNGSGSNAWANDDGHIGSNGNITAATDAKIFGNAAPGISASITLTGTAAVSGATANATTSVAMPPIVVPVIASSGNMTFNADTTLAAGSYHYATTITSNNVALTISGPATVVFDSLTMQARSNLRVDSTNGPVNIYVVNDFVMHSHTLIAANDFDPRALHLNLVSDNIINPGVTIDLDDVILASNSRFYGTLYAPDAFIDIDSNFELYGSLIAEKVRTASDARVHYDEALGRVLAPGVDRYTRISWRVMH